MNDENTFSELIEQSRVLEKHSIRPNTLKTYENYLRMYQTLLKQIPGSPEPFPLTLDKMRAAVLFAKKTFTLSSLKLLISSFAYHFNSNSHPDLTKDPSFKRFFKAIRLEKTEAHPFRKEPITPQILIQLSKNINLNNFFQLRLFTMITVMFAGFLRFREAANLKMGDIVFIDEAMRICIRVSKTDPFGKGVFCFIYKTDKEYCAYTWMKKYISKAKFDENDNIFITNNSNFNEQFRSLLIKYVEPGVDVYSYSSHSMRRGGAQTAAKMGIQDNVIQRHGRWKSTIFMEYTLMERKDAGEIITKNL